MKMMVRTLASCCLAIPLSGCGPSPSKKKKVNFTPTKNGFGVTAQWIGVDSGPGAAFCYKGTNDVPVLVWPSIGTAGYPILYSNDVAFLLADKPDSEGRLGNRAMIAVKSAGPALDISGDLLRIAAAQCDMKTESNLVYYMVGQLKPTNDCIYALFIANPFVVPKLEDIHCTVTWREVLGIMDDVRVNGKTNRTTMYRDPNVNYLMKDYRK